MNVYFRAAIFVWQGGGLGLLLLRQLLSSRMVRKPRHTQRSSQIALNHLERSRRKRTEEEYERKTWWLVLLLLL